MVSSPEYGIPRRFPIRWREFQWVPSMTKTSLSFPLSVVLALLVFAIDVLVPIPGSAEPVLYLWSIWIAARTGDLRWTLCMAVVVTLLATVAPLLSPTSEAWLLSLETDGRLAIPGVRAVVVMSIWGTVLAVLPLIKARRSLQQSQALLQAETVSQAEQLVQIRREKSAIELEAEQALRDSEALYHSLVEHLPLSVLRKDARLRYTFVNRRFLDYSGMSLERLLGRTDFELFPEELAQRYRAGDEEVLSTGRTLESVDSYVDPRGEQRWIRVIKSPVYDAQRAVVGVQILASDVTARQQAEEALANSRTELEARHGELQQSQLRLQQQHHPVGADEDRARLPGLDEAVAEDTRREPGRRPPGEQHEAGIGQHAEGPRGAGQPTLRHADLALVPQPRQRLRGFQRHDEVGEHGGRDEEVEHAVLVRRQQPGDQRHQQQRQATRDDGARGVDRAVAPELADHTGSPARAKARKASRSVGLSSSCSAPAPQRWTSARTRSRATASDSPQPCR